MLEYGFELNHDLNEYSIYFLDNKEIFCHLSESDFEVFKMMCDRSGCKLSPIL